jgi:hypothetical protein
MGIRDTIAERRTFAAAAAAGLILLGCLLIWWEAAGARAGGGGAISDKAFFTVDDGESYFIDDLRKVPPFKTAAGKVASRAQVVRCGDGKPFVLYLEKYGDDDKRRLEEAIKRGGSGGALSLMLAGPGSTAMVKRPRAADAPWVQLSAATAQQYQAVVRPVCPDGGPAERVAPE